MAISFANRFNADLLEENYQRWRVDPASVDSTWAAFFEGFELGSVSLKKSSAATLAPGSDAALQTRVDGLVFSYRTLGHTIAQLDPLAHERPENPRLSLRELGFSEKDFDLTVSTKYFLGGKPMKLREMLAALGAIYSDRIGLIGADLLVGNTTASNQLLITNGGFVANNDAIVGFTITSSNH